MKFLNIDNCLQPLVDFPVIFTPSRYMSHYSEEGSKAFLNLLIEKNTRAFNMNLFNSIIVDIEVNINNKTLLTKFLIDIIVLFSACYFEDRRRIC